MSIEPTPEIVTEKLREALAELRRPISPLTGDGWDQCCMGTQDSCKCLDGALFWTARRLGLPYSVLDAMRRRVAEVIADITGGEAPLLAAPFIWNWNDAEERVFAEVEAVLERAIDAKVGA